MHFDILLIPARRWCTITSSQHTIAAATTEPFYRRPCPPVMCDYISGVVVAAL